MYAERFWKKNWDERLQDLDSKEFETTYVDMIKKAFKQVPDKTALGFLGVDNPRRPGSEIVKAYVQLDPLYHDDGDEEALKEDIIKFAKEKCSPYEVPKVIEIINEMPLTAVGKIDKKVLRVPQGSI